MTDRADLVVVGAGTVGGWASVFAKADGLGRVVVLERGISRRWRLVAGGRDRPRAGRDAGDGRARTLVDRLLQRPAGRLRHRFGLPPLGYLILAVTEEDERAGRERVAMQRANGLDVTWLDAAAGGRDRRHAVSGRPSRRQLPRDRRRDRPAAQRPRLLARDAGGRRGAPRADGVHRPAHGARPGRRHARRRGRDRRRRHRDRARAADRRPEPARGRAARPASASRSGRPGTRSRVLEPHPAFDVRVDADGLRYRRRAVLAARGGRSAVRLERPGRGPGRGALDRLAVLRRDAGEAGRPGAGDRRPRAAPDLGATIDYTPDHLPIVGPALDADGATDRGRQRRLAGRPRDDVGAGRRARRRRPGHPRRTDVVDVSDLGLDRFDAEGRSRLAADPIALPFPVERGGRRTDVASTAEPRRVPRWFVLVSHKSRVVRSATGAAGRRQ